MKKITFLWFLFLTTVLVAQPGPNDGVAFNGVDQYFIMPDSDNINTTSVDNRTIETYFKVTDGTNRQVFYKEGAQVNTIKFYVENENLHVGSYRNDGGTNKSIWFRTPVNNNQWYHVALVLDNASRLLFYLDGQLQATNVNFFQLPPHPGNFEIARTQGPARYPNCDTWGTNGLVNECLGNVSNTDNNILYFEGSVYGFRIWGDVRTAEEIMLNKDMLITDPSQPNGEDLIAFIDGDTMVFKDDNGNFDVEEAQGDVLSIDSFEANDVKVYMDNSILKVDYRNDSIPEQLILYDIIGKQVMSVQGTNSIHVSALRTGIYILRASLKGNHTTVKLLIE